MGFDSRFETASEIPRNKGSWGEFGKLEVAAPGTRLLTTHRIAFVSVDTDHLILAKTTR